MRSTRSRQARRGTALYVTVLSTALIVSLLGLTGLTIVRIERRQIAVSTDRRAARTNANSAVELALRVIANDPDWRTTYSSGVETTPQSLGPNATGTLSWILEDSDGSLTDADTELRLKGIGRVGNTLQVSSVRLVAGGLPLSCLEVAICSNTSVSISSNSIVTTTQTIHCNGSVSNSGTVDSDVEAVGLISGTGYNGTTTSPVQARVVPSASVFDYYINNGTLMNYTDIPKSGPTRRIMDVVLSPNSNPFGSTNPQGIYVIDCQNQLMRIKYSRIIGTLVLLDPDPNSDIEDMLSMEPAVANYPSLLVRGGVEFRLQNNPLSEATRGVNFNPPGSPYQGASDVDLADTYPSQIKGLVYVSGDPDIRLGDTIFEGVLVVGNQLYVDIGDTLTVTYDPQFFSNPPPGFFSDSQVTVVPGSWLWDALP